jgi:predicted XRE-type DNA-binding protein
MAYRIVYELVNGVELERNQLILHSCDNGARPVGCCNPAHMRIGSVQDNSNDMTLRQRHGLPASVVKHIMQLLDEGRTQQEIGDLYGVSRETVSAIATGRVYRRHTQENDT